MTSVESVVAKVAIYTKPGCPYCARALALLERKHADIHEISAAFDPKLKSEMVTRAGGRATFPQIFIGDVHVGGCDDLHDLDAKGGLDALLKAG